MIGTTLGHYQVVGKLGEGGMGEVYRARDTRLGRDVALKVLPESFAADPSRRTRFEREARLLATLNHPHIATIHGVEQAGAQLALVLELVEGPTLADRLATGPLSLAETVAIARQIADALDAAHEKSIVHRDLKPQNVKLTANGAVKLLDFGIAKAMTSDAVDLEQAPTITAGTREGTILGTAAYMSPEQARGQPVDKRTDIWAFGCGPFEMLTGRRAFSGTTLSDTLVSVLERDPEWEALPPSTPAQVRRLLRRTLEKDPRRRLRDIADAAIDLVPDDTADLRPVSRLLSLARRWAPIAAAFVLGAATLWMVRAARSGPDPLAAPNVMPVSFTIAPPAGWTFGSFVPDVETTYMALSPDGSQLAFVAIAPDGVSAVWVRALASTEVRRLAGTDGAVSVFWSPDGRALAFFANGKLQRLDLPNGAPVSIADVPTRVGLTGTWGQDRILFDSILASQISSVSPAGGAVTTAVSRDESRGEFRLYWPRFLPDGRRALYLARHGDGFGDLRLLDPSGTSRSITRVTSNAEYVDAGYLVFARDSTLLAQPFDTRTGTISGLPTPVADPVDYFFYPSRAAFSTSRSGNIVYQSHRDVSRLIWVDRTGKESSSVGPPGAYGAMRLSHDRNQLGIAVRDPRAGTQDVWTIDLTRGDMMSRVTSDPRPETPGPSVPGGRGLLFGAARTGPPQLHYKDFSTGEERVLLPAGDFQIPTDITSDGTLVILTRRAARGGASDLQTLRLDVGGEPVPLVATAFNESEGRVSPDGSLLAFVSDESKRPNVYVTTFPPSGQPLRVSADGGTQPRWSHDGGELFFMSATRMVMAAPIRRGARLEAGEGRPLFSTGARAWLDFDVGRDGRFLAHVPQIIAREQPLTVIVNWPAGIRR